MMLRLAIALSLAAYSAISFATQDPWEILQKTAYAARELNYQGVFEYQNGNQTRSVQITHMNNAGREFTRNVVINNLQAGQAREVFSEGNNIVIFHPKNEKIMIEKRRGQNLFPAMLPTDLRALKQSYSAKIGMLDQVAGRATQIVELIPNDAFRYSYKIWADVEFGLLVKMSLQNQKNETLEHLTFNQLSMLNTQDLNWFQPKIDVSKSYEMEDVSTLNHVTRNWIVTELPPGYIKVDHVERVVKGKKHPVNQMIFSDGIASVSLFIEPLSKGMRPKMGHMLVGSTNMCANVIDGYQVIVVGEVPAATVQQIARAVTFKKQTALNK